MREIDHLAARWSDEHEFEDFSEYESVLKSSFEKFNVGTFKRATKRPFGVVFTADNLEFQIKATMKQIKISVKPFAQ
jgi:hypothetical protein